MSRYVREGISLNAASGATGRPVTPVPQMKSEVEILKQLVWHYVIENPALLTQQQGVRFVMQSLFKFFMDKAETRNFDIFPEPYRAALSSSEDDEHARTVIDMISGMTEVQALRLHARLLGVSLGSVLDRL